MTIAARRDRFKSVVQATVKSGAALASLPYSGALSGPPLEDTTRRLALDPMIAALGWDLGYDVAQEARVVGNTTLYIDYLGVHRETREAEMIFEAKAWDASMISPSGAKAGLSPSALAALTVTHVKGGRSGKSPVTKDWTDKIEQLHRYVVLMHRQSGFIVQRVAISSGQWIMIFRDPKGTFVDPGAATSDDILVLEGVAMVTSSDAIYSWLARETLSDAPRAPIRATQLPLYHRRGVALKASYRALWIGHAEGGTEHKSKPSLSVHAAVVVERDDGALLQVIDADRDFDVPANAELLGEHLTAVEDASRALLDEISDVLDAPPLQPLGIELFPGFRSANGGERAAASPSPSKPGNLLIVTGAASHYLRAGPEVAECPFHVYAASLSVGRAIDPTISVRSHRPPSFFTTGEAHHCTHRDVGDEKERIPCPIAPVEERLCCRACSLQERCWTDRRLARLPCGAVI